MSDIKSYVVRQTWGDYEVQLEVDFDILTPEHAKDHIDFWSGADEFRDAESGSDQLALIRLFGSRMISLMLSEGWSSFQYGQAVGKLWTEQLQNEEGWAGHDGTPFGRVGIRVVSASVDGVGFDDVELEECAE